MTIKKRIGKRTRPQLDKHLAAKYNCSLTYARQILSGMVIPTKGVGLAVLQDVQRIYEEPVSTPEWESKTL